MYETRLKHLEQAHHMLDKKIAGLESTGCFEDTQIQDLKKQKLQLRDQIEDLKRKHEDE